MIIKNLNELPKKIFSKREEDKCQKLYVSIISIQNEFDEELVLSTLTLIEFQLFTF